MASSSQILKAHRFDLATMRHMPRFKREITALKNKYIDAQIASWRVTGGLSKVLEDKHANDMAQVFRENYRRIMKSAVSATSDTIDGLKSRELKEYDTHEAALMSYYTQYGGTRAKATATTTTADIRRLLRRAFEDGEPESVVLKQGLLAKGLSAWRADTIARTETHLAAMFANKYTVDEISRDTGLQFEKAWIPTLDERTRESHASMNADDYIAEDSQFMVGGEAMEYPGDPSASAENVINCRCVVGRRVVR